MLKIIPNIPRSEIKSLLTAANFKKGNLQHLAASVLVTANLLAFDNLRGEMSWSSSCRLFEGHYSVAKM